MSSGELWVCNLGTIDYESALALQERVRAARQRDQIPDVLLLLEHDPPVYTRGRRSAPGELTMGDEWYASRGISIIETKRGGKVTYHGPGQLVGYPIVRVDDVVAHVRLIERALVTALGEEGISARDRASEGPDYTGVWVEDRKIASIGVHVSRGVSAHGFAINVDNDLAPFSWVVACGLPSVHMTSITAEKGGESLVFGESRSGADTGMACFRKRAAFAMARELGLRQRLVSLDRLERYAAAAAVPAPDSASAVSDAATTAATVA